MSEAILLYPCLFFRNSRYLVS